MEKIISGKKYDTETAEFIASWSNNLGAGNFRNCREELYRTKKGGWFLYGEGGAMTTYSESYSDGQGPGENIVVLNDDEVKEWLEKHHDIDTYEKYFEVEQA